MTDAVDTLTSLTTGPDVEQRQTAAEELYQDGTLVLVGCGKAKRDPEDPTDRHLAVEGRLIPDPQQTDDLYWRAEDLYTSTYFQTKREFAETVTRWTTDHENDTPRWAILSAEHQILFPWERVQRYDTTIDDLGDDPTNPEHRVFSLGRRRPDGQEIVTKLDQWATVVAYGLARWLAMFREEAASPSHATDASTLLVLAGQDYIEPLRERGVFEYGISRMVGDPNDAYELDVNVRFLFEEIDAGGIGDQMAWMSDAIGALEKAAEPTEQTALSGGES